MPYEKRHNVCHTKRGIMNAIPKVTKRDTLILKE